ncbi:hypothetical protein BGZ74_006853, partial [Mortierella antarctica]
TLIIWPTLPKPVTVKSSSYIDKISTFPGFYLEYNRQTSRMQTDHNIDLMINDIKAMYDGVVD